MKNVYISMAVVFLTLSCTTTPAGEGILDPTDYAKFIASEERPALELAHSNREFWSKRLRPDSSGVGDLAPLASAYEALFENTGDPRHLYRAEILYKKGMEISANDKDAFARGLAHNYISQHRFKEAYELLQSTLEGPSNKHETQLMLFDAAMEVGDYEKAYQYLNAVKNMKDYQYLIRLSKWNDYRGDLDAAIQYMEQAREIADSRDNKSLKIWTYSNLGDYYGHAGRIGDSYEHYLKTLQLQPD
ncbi:MAG: tetratricopeptide repeat protein, partial [Flavobacteriaceae bacterium]|nr:tetratricopeptide repeat protein [Flavobacteriaceae bacterium]